MKGAKPHRVPLTDEMLRILEPMKAMASTYVFEGQKRHHPLSNMSMLMLLRRMGRGDFTVHGFRSTFRDWGPDFMDPHSNAKAFAYNSNNSDDSYAATTTWRNAWAVPDAMNKKTMSALTEGDAETRLGMYRELQAEVQAESPIVIMFQAAYQVAMNEAISGYVNGATSDFVFYRLVEKN